MVSRHPALEQHVGRGYLRGPAGLSAALVLGRACRSVQIFDHGRPRRVQLLVLIDRGHREIPVEAQYVGKYVETTDAEIIEVKFKEVDQMEKVLLVEKTD